MPIDHLKVGLPVGHYTNYTDKWSIGSICQIGGHLHKIGQHTYAGTDSKGNFGSGGDLPGSGNALGDYYICDTNGFVSTEAGLTFDNGDSALYDGAAWSKPPVAPCVCNIHLVTIDPPPTE